MNLYDFALDALNYEILRINMNFFLLINY